MSSSSEPYMMSSSLSFTIENEGLSFVICDAARKFKAKVINQINYKNPAEVPRCLYLHEFRTAEEDGEYTYAIVNT